MTQSTRQRFEARIEIAAPPRAVWHVLADVAAWPAWDPTTDKVEGEAAPGAAMTLWSSLAPGQPLPVTVTAMEQVLTMTRRFEASPERVYDAWTDPALASLWLFTGPGTEDHVCTMDPRPGGRWTISSTREGRVYTATGEFLQTDRPRALQLTFAMPQFSHEHDLITVTFEADGDGCIMRFRQEGLAQVAKGPSESGWTPMFWGLAAAIGAPQPAVL